jgi:hypothetical protein
MPGGSGRTYGGGGGTGTGPAVVGCAPGQAATAAGNAVVLASSDGLGILFVEKLFAGTIGSGEVGRDGLFVGEAEGVGVGVGEVDVDGETTGELVGDGSSSVPANADVPVMSAGTRTAPTNSSRLDLFIASGTPRPGAPAVGQAPHPIRAGRPRPDVRLR